MAGKMLNRSRTSEAGEKEIKCCNYLIPPIFMSARLLPNRLDRNTS